jgi:hypothetical protein
MPKAENSKHTKAPLTKAGEALVRKFLEVEGRGRLLQLRGKDGLEFGGIALPHGDGGAKAAAEKLTRDGYAGMQWSRSFGAHRGRYFWLTECGRRAGKALAEPSSN